METIAAQPSLDKSALSLKGSSLEQTTDSKPAVDADVARKTNGVNHGTENNIDIEDALPQDTREGAMDDTRRVNGAAAQEGVKMAVEKGDSKSSVDPAPSSSIPTGVSETSAPAPAPDTSSKLPEPAKLQPSPPPDAPVKSSESMSPAATTTVPPPITQPVSDMRDDAAAIPPTVEVDHSMEDVSVPDPAPTQDKPETTDVDMVDASANDHLPGGDAEKTLATEKAAKHENTAPAIAPGSTESKPETSSGQVRPREDDDVAEPSAKRTKVDGEDVKSELNQPPAPTSSEAPAGVVTGPAGVPPRPTSYDSNPLTKVQQKWFLENVRKAKKTKNAVPFNTPVDPVKLGIPNYFDVVKHPMDLSTIEEKLKKEEYSTADAVMADFDLMVANCVTFNGTQHQISQLGFNLQAYFRKLMTSLPKGEAAAGDPKPKKPAPPPKPAHPRRESRTAAQASRAPAPPPPPPPPPKKETKAPSGFLDTNGMPIIRRDSSSNNRPKREIIKPVRDLPQTPARPKKKHAVELKFCAAVHKHVSGGKFWNHNQFFQDPVDPVALNIPDYHKIVKKPMDLRTIQEKLKMQHYSTGKEFYDDMKLMFQNCYKFNPVGDHVYSAGQALERIFDDKWKERDEFLAQHAPPSEPLSPASEEEEPEEEEESEEEEDVAETERQEKIRLLQEKLQSLTNELSSLVEESAPTNKPPMKKKKKKSKTKKDEKEKPSKSRRASGPSASTTDKGKTKPKKYKKLTMDQKRTVSEKIGQLDERDMRKAVQLIRNGVPHLKNVHDDELELDIEEIPDHVLWDLYCFLNKAVPQADVADEDDYEPPAVHSKPAASGRKKHKPMSAREQESQIQQVRAQLERFHGGGDAEDVKGQESDDDDSESSEEE